MRRPKGKDISASDIIPILSSDPATVRSYKNVVAYFGIQAPTNDMNTLTHETKICIVHYEDQYKDLWKDYANTIFIVVTEKLLPGFDIQYQYIGQWKTELFGEILHKALKTLPAEKHLPDYIKVGSWRYYREYKRLVRGHYRLYNTYEPSKWYLRLLDYLIKHRKATFDEIMQHVYYDRKFVDLGPQLVRFKSIIERCPNCKVIKSKGTIYFTERWLWMNLVGRYRYKLDKGKNKDVLEWLGQEHFDSIEEKRRPSDATIMAYMWDEEMELFK